MKKIKSNTFINICAVKKVFVFRILGSWKNVNYNKKIYFSSHVFTKRSAMGLELLKK